VPKLQAVYQTRCNEIILERNRVNQGLLIAYHPALSTAYSCKKERKISFRA
jgi:hypothetical protein